MTFESEDRAALRESVRMLLAKHSDSAAVRKAIASPDGYDADLWTRLVEQVGVAALAIPEEYDGVGASLAETHVVLEELGRTLAPTPFLGSAVLAAQALLLYLAVYLFMNLGAFTVVMAVARKTGSGDRDRRGAQVAQDRSASPVSV